MTPQNFRVAGVKSRWPKGRPHRSIPVDAPATCDLTIEIPLTQGYVTIIDAEDYERVRQLTWHVLESSPRLQYAVSTSPRPTRTIRMHRFIMNAPEGVHIDHINGNGLDNRRANLRFATRSQNGRNKDGWGKRSNYKGVYPWHGKKGTKWACIIWDGKKQRFLGRFPSEEEAARVFDAWSVKFAGPFARLNFPQNHPSIVETPCLKRNHETSGEWI